MTSLPGIALIFVCALALMALEAFVPGISIAGIAGVILFGFDAWLCWSAYGAAWAIILLIAGGCLSFLITRAMLRSMKKGRLSKTGVFLSGPTAPAVKTAAHEGTIVPGSVGVAKSALHPAGIAEFDKERIHVVSENGFVEKDDALIVVRTEGARVVVRRLEKENVSD